MTVLDEQEASIALGVSKTVLRRWRQKGIGPQYIKYGKTRSSKIRYDIADIEAFKQAHKVETKGHDSENIVSSDGAV